jgi:hypothetical protein
MAQARRDEHYPRLNITTHRGHLRKLRRALVFKIRLTSVCGRDVGLAESGFRPTLIGVANREAVGASIDPIDRYDQIKRFDKSIFRPSFIARTL